jgi:hypothetical protein
MTTRKSAKKVWERPRLRSRDVRETLVRPASQTEILARNGKSARSARAADRLGPAS